MRLLWRVADSPPKRRLKDACGGFVTPEAIIKMRTPLLNCLRELFQGFYFGSEDKAIEKLSKIWGIGTWTAEMFLIFALGRTDVFSVGDLGLLRAMEDIYQIPQSSPKLVYIEIAERWSPYRSVASLALWRHWDSV